MEIVGIWVIGAVLVAWWAHTKRRSAVLALLLAILLSPIVAAIIVAIWKDGESVEYGRARAGRSADYITCPKCAELVRREAVTCRHCGADLTAQGGSSEEAATRRLVEALERKSRT